MIIKLKVILTATEHKKIINIISNMEDIIKEKQMTHITLGDKILKVFYNNIKDIVFVERMDKELYKDINGLLVKYNKNGRPKQNKNKKTESKR